MSKEQIEEMAKLIAVQRMYGCNEKDTCDMSCKVYKCGCIPYEDATILYNADYRKQSEGEWYVNYMMSKKPSKRGRTIQYTTYTCSVCGKPNGRKKSKFCPNCGAKMKGGVEQ